MDTSETLVSQHLTVRGFKDVKYEPDGKIPPDFLVNGSIAIEVRRLNQMHDDGSGTRPRGLEEAAIPFWKFVRRHLEELAPSPTGEGWYVHVRYGRPLPKAKIVGKQLDQILVPFISRPHRATFSERLPCGIEITVFPTTIKKPTFFQLGGVSDDEAGGWLLCEMETNLIRCIEEKTHKIERYRQKYPTWWLALVDHIGYGLDAFERELFRDRVTVQHSFDKVILIDPKNPNRSFEV